MPARSGQQELESLDSNTPRRWLTALNAVVRKHPKRISGVVLGVLGGFAVAAFGIAPLAPDAAKLPQRLVIEPVQVAGLDAQAEDLALHELQLWRSDVTRSTDTADSLLRRLGVSDPTAASFIRVDRTARRIIEGRGGKMVQARVASDGTLIELVARYPAADEAQAATHFSRLSLKRFNGPPAAEAARCGHHHLAAIIKPNGQPLHRVTDHRNVDGVVAALVRDIQAILNRADFVSTTNHVLGEEKPGGEITVGAGCPHDHGKARAVDPDFHRFFDGNRVALRRTLAAARDRDLANAG